MYYIGIDLGTSSVKLVLMDENGIIKGEVANDYDVYYLNGNWAEQNPEDWWECTFDGLKSLINQYVENNSEISAISFSGQMHGLVALDNEGRVIRPSILWCDQRTDKECRDIEEFFGEKKLSKMVGNKVLTGFTAPKILWMKKNEKEKFDKIAHILLPKDYIRYKLSGDFATDVSDASGMLTLDVKNRVWCDDMLNYLGISHTVMPSLFESYEVTGCLKESIKKELNITGEVKIVAGAGDQAAGAIGTGTVSNGMVAVTLGTSGVIFASHDDYFVDDDNRLHAFCHGNGKYHSMGVMLSAASCLNWYMDKIIMSDDFENILKDAEDKMSDLVFLPYLIGERTPYADPEARGCFVGLDMTTDRGHMTRAVLEGVAFGLKDSLDILKDMSISIEEIRIIGGGSKSPLWKQILADVFGLPIYEINTTMGGALGAGILAAVGDGAFKNVEEACDKIIKTVSSVKPNDNMKKYYEKKHKKFKNLYSVLKNNF